MSGLGQKAKSEVNLSKSIPVVSVMGPSLGARTIIKTRAGTLQPSIKLTAVTNKDKMNLIKSRQNKSYAYLEAMRKGKEEQSNHRSTREAGISS